MSREIKFRAFVGGRGMYNLLGFRSHINGRTIYPLDSEGLEMDSWYFMDKQELHIMQYTGLKDKNGVDIYEHDLLKLDNEVGAVQYTNGFWIPFDQHAEWHDPANKWEVIGNIHQNPELLK